MSIQYIAIIKQDYVPLVSEDEEVTPSNVGALKFGLMALLKEDAQDMERAEQFWQKANDLLAKEQDDDIGAGAEGKVQIPDDLQMSTVGIGL